MNIINENQIPENFYKYIDFEGTQSVTEIINDVKNNGDDAIRKYSKKFGDGDIAQFKLTQEEIAEAFNQLDSKVIGAIKTSIKNVKSFAKAQIESVKNQEIEVDGSILGHKIIPLERVGAYVPGGNYPLPSSAIMSVVPAKVAGVKEVVVCSPKIQPATIVASSLAGADKIYRIGGVQAIAGMAYGTSTINKVDKITGPGNKFVTMAKKEVYGVCGIDFLAGPSEVMIIADEHANPAFIAADMLAQCEHDKDAQAYLLTSCDKMIEAVQNSIDKLLETLETKEIAKVALKNSFIIKVDSIENAIEIANKKAPEHLEICFKNAFENKDKFINYGSLFIGDYSAEVFGDYASGTNHVLPTNGVARYSGGLSVFDFIKILTYQKISKEAIVKGLGSCTSTLAGAEGLMAHKMSADLRRV